ncbi:hypothetical protein [Bacillus toyonensis]|uniref:hypothetical protein n=1 Tax=Bacillus toyonensis TaxID=155322 RepID=UPI0011452D99|nr:hypothetical protein [Bacillus toyonensis]
METKKIKLNKEYLEDHKIGIHDYTSFGRVLCEQIMNTAIEEIGDQEVDSHEINLKINVSPVARFGCLNVCVDSFCIHIPNNPRGGGGGGTLPQ